MTEPKRPIDVLLELVERDKAHPELAGKMTPEENQRWLYRLGQRNRDGSIPTQYGSLYTDPDHPAYQGS